ncbi:DUF6112 family protein [Streptomyces sp. S1]|uniref:DUF6112 family protein n=1 Tax=Streptomyces sp. S1 TaxID=718288 RepID=UPI003D74AA38
MSSPTPYDHLVRLAFDPGISPKGGGLPGLEVLRSVVSSLNLFCIVAVAGALAISLGVWAWGHHTGGHQAESNGKKGALVCVGAALGLGAVNGIIAFFTALGSHIR